MRGEIRNRQRAGQLRDFSGLRFGNITPTDVDGYLDFLNKLFVWMEAKYDGEELPFGQRLALERGCDAQERGGVNSTVLILDHDTPSEQDIDFANCLVREYRLDGEWIVPRKPIACRRAIEKFLKRGGIPL